MRRPALIAKLLVAIVVQTLAFCALLFVPAATTVWWRGWVFVGVVFAGSLAAAFGLLNVNEDLLVERLKPPLQKDQSRADKFILPAIVVAFAALTVLVPLDVFRLHLLAKPNLAVSTAGLVFVVAGWCIAYSSLRENAFASNVVKHQKDRGHAVVDSGPYRIVRHPMYAGGFCVLGGMPLWLESSAGALFALVPAALLVVRIFAEEAYLRRELPGYAAYAQRVRYRLLPSIW